MKHVIILGDGMADWAVPSLGDKTYCSMHIRHIWINWQVWGVRAY